MKNELRSWEKEKKLIPIMITMYCKGNHKFERKQQGIKNFAHFARYIAINPKCVRK